MNRRPARPARTTLLALPLVSGAALAALVHVESRALEARPLAVHLAGPTAAASPEARATDRVQPEAAAPARAGAVADVAPALATGPGAAAPAAAPAVAPAAETRVRVPNFVGIRLTYALHRARTHGLELAIVDEVGEPVLLEDAEFYRVTSQSVRRGRDVAAGETIEIVVRDRTASYSDWG